MSRVLGIDLGTTNSVMAYMKRGQPTIIENREDSDLTPSAIAYKSATHELSVGQSAKSRPKDVITSAKRFIGRTFDDPNVQKAMSHGHYEIGRGADGGVMLKMGAHMYTPVEVASLVLRKMKDDAERKLADVAGGFSQAVITVPAYFGERQVDATRQAGRMAGFNVIRVINEPTAAALAYGVGRENSGEARTVLVYDFGGGTFDISTILVADGTFSVLSIEGDNLLGGDDFDNDLVSMLMGHIGRKVPGFTISKGGQATTLIRQRAEDAKKALSNSEETEMILPSFVNGEDFEVTIRRPEFEALIRPRVEKSIELTRLAISKAGLSLANIDAILLVGGSTRVPLIQRMLAEAFGEAKLRRDVNPMQCVALGAAIASTMSTDAACPSCGNRNPIEALRCTCGAQLEPGEKTQCRNCFMWVDAGESNCWKCQQPMGSAGAGSRPIRVKPVVASTAPAEPDGLACAKCGTVNKRGAAACSNCGAPTGGIFDITPKSIGIELKGGDMARLLPAGTTFPTGEPIGDEFFTSAANQRRIEIPVFEGEDDRVSKNELLGRASIDLPAGLPAKTPVSIRLGLDEDRTVVVHVQVRDARSSKGTVRLKRVKLTAEQVGRIETARVELLHFIDRWTIESDELTEAELADLRGRARELETCMNDGPPRNKSIDDIIAEGKAVCDLATEIRGSDAWISALRDQVGKYIDVEKRARLEAFSAALDRVRAAADWSQGRRLVEEFSGLQSEIPGNLLMICHCRTLAVQDLVSADLKRQIIRAFDVFDEAYDRGDTNGVGDALKMLNALDDKAIAEVKERGSKRPDIDGGKVTRR